MFRTPAATFDDSLIPNAFEKSRAASPLLCRPYALGEQNVGGRLCENRLNGEYEIIYVKKGPTRIISGDRNDLCGDGSFLIIPPFVPHTIISDRENPHHNYWCHFQIEPAWKRLGINRALSDKGGYALLPAEEETKDLIEKIFREGTKKEEGYLSVMEGLLTSLVIILLRKKEWSQESGKTPAPDESRALESCLKLIEENAHRAYTAGRLRDDSGYSSSWILKLFNRYLQISPSRYIMQCRLKQAHALLIHEKKSVKETAWELDFSSPYHLSRVFKEFYGCSPSEWSRP